MASTSVLDLDPCRYESSDLHRADRDWQESNCYIDVWIELIHALGLEVHASLPFTLAADFEDDQWTFYKPPHSDLYELYGLMVEELTVWRSIPEHCFAQIRGGKLLLLEVDSFFLPDTKGADYRSRHTKTSVAINEIAIDEKRLGYFHNTGYHTLSHGDFDGLFRLDRSTPEDHLAPYCEIIKLDRLKRSSASSLRERSIKLATDYLRRRPEPNPMVLFGDSISSHLQYVMDRGIDTYHLYVFASIRQCGSCFEFASEYLRWLSRDGDEDWLDIAGEFQTISRISKMLVRKTARMVNARRDADLSNHFSDMAEAWDRGNEQLDRKLRP